MFWLTQSVTRQQTTATRPTTAAVAPLFCGDDAGILLLLFATLVGGPSPSDCHQHHLPDGDIADAHQQPERSLHT